MQDGRAYTPLSDGAFRKIARDTTVALVRRFGSQHLSAIESAVQDAFVRALDLWPTQGIPHNPGGWVYRVAGNRLRDELRRGAVLADKVRREGGAIAMRSRGDVEEVAEVDATFDPVEQDDVLRMMFIVCHPELPVAGRLALVLRTVCGFGLDEVGRALLMREAAVRKQLTRAKAAVARLELKFVVPPPQALRDRVDAVLECLYLLFNEGYSATTGPELTRSDLCAEALRLIQCMVDMPQATDPEIAGRIHALAALMSLHAARLPARVASDGSIVLLAEQDRSRWDAMLLRRGFGHLQASLASSERTRFHLEAGIAGCHAVARTADETDWGRIEELYAELMTLSPSPVVALNHAVAVGMARSPKEALRRLDVIENERALRDYHLLAAVRAEMLERQGDLIGAREALAVALSRVSSEPERRLLERRRDRLLD